MRKSSLVRLAAASTRHPAVFTAGLLAGILCIATTSFTPMLAAQQVQAAPCETRFVIEPADQRMLDWIGTPATLTTFYSTATFWDRKDFDSKLGVVAPWPRQLTPEKIASLQTEYRNQLAASKDSKLLPVFNDWHKSWPLDAQQLASLSAWFSSRPKKQFSGLCMDQGNVDYALALGILKNRATPDCGTVIANAKDRQAGCVGSYCTESSCNGTELQEMVYGDQYTVVLFYRAAGSASREAGPRPQAPDYFFVLGPTLPATITKPDFTTLQPALSVALKFLASVSHNPQ
jgi:hypothetical protein